MKIYIRFNIILSRSLSELRSAHAPLDVNVYDVRAELYNFIHALSVEMVILVFDAFEMNAAKIKMGNLLWIHLHDQFARDVTIFCCHYRCTQCFCLLSFLLVICHSLIPFIFCPLLSPHECQCRIALNDDLAMQWFSNVVAYAQWNNRNDWAARCKQEM